MNERPQFPGSLKAKRAVYSRNGIAWLSTRAWRRDVKRRDVWALKVAKRNVDQLVIARAAADVVELMQLLFGTPRGFLVSTVAVGHSRRPDSFAVRLAEAVAAELGLPFVRLFADRFVTGSSHPKEFRKLPPLQRLIDPSLPVLLVDDVVTSGWHIEEAMQNLRTSGNPCLAVCWISGTVKGEGDELPLMADLGVVPTRTGRSASLALAMSMAPFNGQRRRLRVGGRATRS